MLEILNLMVHQSLGNLREKKNLICSSVSRTDTQYPLAGQAAAGQLEVLV